jgi:hypothetical protein
MENELNNIIGKQMIIHRILLPDIVLSNINDYLFYKQNTPAHTRLLEDRDNTRKWKSKFVNEICQSRSSHTLYEDMINEYRNHTGIAVQFYYTSIQKFIDDHYNPFWFFFDATMENSVYSSFEATFCGKCGNYQMLFPQFSKKCQCTC